MRKVYLHPQIIVLTEAPFQWGKWLTLSLILHIAFYQKKKVFSSVSFENGMLIVICLQATHSLTIFKLQFAENHTIGENLSCKP